MSTDRSALPGLAAARLSSAVVGILRLPEGGFVIYLAGDAVPRVTQ